MMFKAKQTQAEMLAERIAQIEKNYGLQLAKVRADQLAIRKEIERLQGEPSPTTVVDQVYHAVNREQVIQGLNARLKSLEVQTRELKRTKELQVKTLTKQAERLSS